MSFPVNALANLIAAVVTSDPFFPKRTISADGIISTNFYHKRLYRTTYNADEVDAEECAEDSAADATELKNDYGFEDAPLCGEDNSAGDYGIILDQFGNAIESNDNIRKYGLLNKTFTTTTTMGGDIKLEKNKNSYGQFAEMHLSNSGIIDAT